MYENKKQQKRKEDKQGGDSASSEATSNACETCHHTLSSAGTTF